MIDFISAENEYDLDLLDTQNDMICIWINSNYYVFKYKGQVKFFQDGNGVGESWIDFSHDINIELVHELSDENITLLNFHEEYLVEWIVEQIYLDKEKGDE